MSIAANKVPGVRAAVVWSDKTAALAAEHNGANVLCSGRPRAFARPAIARMVRLAGDALLAKAATRAGYGKIARLEKGGDPDETTYLVTSLTLSPRRSLRAASSDLLKEGLRLGQRRPARPGPGHPAPGRGSADSGDAAAQTALGLVALQRQQYAEAQAALERALSLDPQSETALFCPRSAF
jgi:tetratricopeptide (TPR) repeat protein